MIELGTFKRNVISDICKSSSEVVVLSAAHGYTGRVWADNMDNPSMCVIKTQDYIYLCGLAPKGTTSLDLKTIIMSEGHDCYIIPPDSRWENWFETNIDCPYRTVTRYAMNKQSTFFDQKKLKEFMKDIPEGFHVKKIDDYTFKMIEKAGWCSCLIDSYRDADDFLSHATGYVVQKGREIVSGCSCFAHTDTETDITIKTKEEYRKMKLGKAVASAYILEQLDAGMYPSWDAANQISVRLAEKLGYKFDKEYTAFQL